MQDSAVSFEKIPLLENKPRNEVLIEDMATVYTRNNNGFLRPKFQGRTVSTNTAPDVIYLLDNLKSEVFSGEKEPTTVKSIKPKKKVIVSNNNSITIQKDSEDIDDMKARRKRNIDRYFYPNFNLLDGVYSV